MLFVAEVSQFGDTRLDGLRCLNLKRALGFGRTSPVNAQLPSILTFEPFSDTNVCRNSCSPMTA